MVTEEEIRARLRLGCICKGIKLHVIITAIDAGARSYNEISQKTGIGGGSCKGKRCGEKVKELLTQGKEKL